MSYDIQLLNPKTKEVVELSTPHHMMGGTYAIGGDPHASLNITYNYSPWFQRYIDKKAGIRYLYGMTASRATAVLEAAIAQMSGNADSDYWMPTEGNAKKALVNLLALCKMVPSDSIVNGD